MFLPILSLSSANMCKVDWLTQWRNKASAFAKPYNVMFSRGFDTTTSGTWSFSKDGYTVSGTSQCGSSATLTGSGSNWHNEIAEIDAATNANNRHCWCRMTSPTTGSSWVFSYSHASSANCALGCSGDCSHCVQNGAHSSCVRSALLAI